MPGRTQQRPADFDNRDGPGRQSHVFQSRRAEPARHGRLVCLPSQKNAAHYQDPHRHGSRQPSGQAIEAHRHPQGQRHDDHADQELHGYEPRLRPGYL